MHMIGLSSGRVGGWLLLKTPAGVFVWNWTKAWFCFANFSNSKCILFICFIVRSLIGRLRYLTRKTRRLLIALRQTGQIWLSWQISKVYLASQVSLIGFSLCCTGAWQQAFHDKKAINCRKRFSFLLFCDAKALLFLKSIRWQDFSLVHNSSCRLRELSHHLIQYQCSLPVQLKEWFDLSFSFPKA